MILNRRNVLLSATVGAAGAVMTNTVNAKQRNQDPDMDAIIARMMNVTERGTTLSTNQKYFISDMCSPGPFRRSRRCYSRCFESRR